MIGLNKIGLNQVQLNRLRLNAPFPTCRKMAGGGGSSDVSRNFRAMSLVGISAA